MDLVARVVEKYDPAMRTIRGLLLGFSATTVVAVIVLLRSGLMPTGIRGEWEWPRIAVRPLPLDFLLAGVGIVAFSGVAAIGAASLRTSTSRARESLWVLGLLVASVGAQLIALSGAPTGYGLTKWVTLALPGSSGYLSVAKSQMRDPWKFWVDYPTWIKSQDALHVGTHPPGLFLVSRAVLGLMESHPELARWVVGHVPESISAGMKIVPAELSRPERAAVAALGALTLLACAATVVPIYWLARANLSATTAWTAAALWPLVPSAILFQPAADTAFPLLATSALALAAWGGLGRAVAAGAVLAVGMQFTLAFLPVGLAVAIVLVWRDGTSWRRRILTILATGCGFVGLTLAVWAASGSNPLVVWWWNQKNHARFYLEYRRSYLPWVAANLVELVIALGLPAAVFAMVGFTGRSTPRSAWAALVVLAILNFSGKNLSEVARLWLPFLPALLVAAAAGLERVAAGPRTLAAVLVLIGLQTLALEATVQVVYPF
ncbi:MAG: hypothetical protein JWN86_2192 [Planctomycetota bacterium]|nr:hypothetical protein [Planctomycetota bacterium]